MKVLLVMASVCAALKAPATLQQRAAALGRSVAPVALALGCMVGGSAVAPANAADGRRVASISASGLVFKDKVVVDAFADPKVEGVTLYVSDFERPLAERMQKDFFSDPSQSGLACSRRAAQARHLGRVGIAFVHDPAALVDAGAGTHCMGAKGMGLRTAYHIKNT